MTVATVIWRVLAKGRGADAATAVLALLDDLVGAVSAFEIAQQEWRVEAYPPSPVLTPVLAAQIAFPPLRIGRFFIHGSHHRGAAPSGTIAIILDAATAFGTGEHPSTRGCLMALDSLSRRRRFRRPLDIGTGSGILAIAAAKLLRRKVLASDIDRGAVR